MATMSPKLFASLASLAAGSQQLTQQLDTIDGNVVNKAYMHHLSEDALALSVCLHRLREKPRPYDGIIIELNVTNPDLLKYINQDDRDKANSIREYYSKKLLWMRLRGDHFTPFRDDLGTFLAGNGKDVMEKMMPMVYRLPELFAYDMEFETVFGSISHVNDNQEPGRFSRFDIETKTIKHIKTFTRVVRRTNIVEYWFRDVKTSAPVLLTFLKNNPLLSLLDLQLKNDHELNLRAVFRLTRRDRFEYYKPDKIMFC